MISRGPLWPPRWLIHGHGLCGASQLPQVFFDLMKPCSAWSGRWSSPVRCRKDATIGAVRLRTHLRWESVGVTEQWVTTSASVSGKSLRPAFFCSVHRLVASNTLLSLLLPWVIPTVILHHISRDMEQYLSDCSSSSSSFPESLSHQQSAWLRLPSLNTSSKYCSGRVQCPIVNALDLWQLGPKRSMRGRYALLLWLWYVNMRHGCCSHYKPAQYFLYTMCAPNLKFVAIMNTDI